MKAIRIVPDDTKINFIGVRLFAFVFSAVMIAASLGLVATKGLNFGIDFTGGTAIEIRVTEDPDLAEMRTRLNDLGLGGISIQEFGDVRDLMVRLPQQEGGAEEQQEAIAKVRAVLDEKFGDGDIDYRRVEFVGPQVGEELKRAGLLAVIFSLMGIMAYIWFRFEWQFGIAALIALTHDILFIIGYFGLTQTEFNLATVAALLMVAGYSINDTVVVFDRIRENLRRYKKMPLDELFNMSVNQMLGRTVMTSVSTLLALGSLWFFGGEVIRGFVEALIVGIIIGTYSSVFIAAATLLYMNLRRDALDKKPADSDKSGAESAA